MDIDNGYSQEKYTNRKRVKRSDHYDDYDYHEEQALARERLQRNQDRPHRSRRKPEELGIPK